MNLAIAILSCIPSLNGGNPVFQDDLAKAFPVYQLQCVIETFHNLGLVTHHNDVKKWGWANISNALWRTPRGDALIQDLTTLPSPKQ